MDATVHVLNRMVNNLMRVVTGKAVIGKQRVSVESRARFDVLLNFGLQCMTLPVRNNHRAHSTAPLQHSHDGYLVFSASTSDAPFPLGNMHVAGLATDESLIGFHFAAEFSADKAIMKSFTDAVHHKPRRLLSYPKGPRNLARTNAVLAIANHPERAHPLVDPKRRILKYCADFKRELLFASLAEPDTARLNKRVFFRSTARAGNNTVRPTKIKRVLETTLWVAEVNNCFLKCLGRVHDLIIALLGLCVKYIIALLCIGFKSPHR